MIEPASLGVVVAALVAKALDRAGDKALEQGEGVLRRTLEAVRQLLSGDPEGGKPLERLEDAPDSATRVRELAQVLDQRMEALPDLRPQLEALVAEAQASGIDVGSIDQVAHGSQIVQVAGVADSEVGVTFQARPGESRTPRPSD
ncbi:MAG TPA: hypothetical protein VGB06_01580 [Solirubrobacterales bacterium]|jgi:hypothetical protein